MNENKQVYIIKRSIITSITTVFLIKLYFYNRLLFQIQTKYCDQPVLKYFYILREPYYSAYLCCGFLFISILVLCMVKDVKDIFDNYLNLTDACIGITINFILFIILICLFANPILTTFAVATFLIGGVSISK